MGGKGRVKRIMGLGQGRGGGVRQIKSEGGSDIGRRVTAREGDAGGFNREAHRRQHFVVSDKRTIKVSLFFFFFAFFFKK